jgi:hypothetical protein
LNVVPGGIAAGDNKASPPSDRFKTQAGIGESLSFSEKSVISTAVDFPDRRCERRRSTGLAGSALVWLVAGLGANGGSNGPKSFNTVLQLFPTSCGWLIARSNTSLDGRLGWYPKKTIKLGVL